MSHAEALAIALVLDAALGEPEALWRRVPHPAVLMGRMIDWADARFNHGPDRRSRGIAALAALCVGAWIVGSVVAALPLGGLIEAAAAFALLAHRSLVDHVTAVATALRRSTVDGRRAVALIVGRDTAEMDDPQIARAAIESAAENFSDGVIAPAFWFLIAGLPGMLVYKAVNTADSMIGYRTPRHADFGWAAAKLDDALNWLPARLTAGIIAIAHGKWHARAEIAEDARLHRSPNAGWPEAAMAAALDVALAGPRSYHGVRREYPFVWPQGEHAPGAAEIDRAVATLWRVWAGAFIIVALLALA